MEGPSKAASEEVVDKTELSPIDDEFMQGPSKAASDEVAAKITEGPSKEASGEAVDEIMIKFPSLTDGQIMKGPSKAASETTRKGYKGGIGLWGILSRKGLPIIVLYKATDKILRNLNPVIDKIMVDQIIEGLRKKYPTDEEVVIDMIIELLSQIFHETMETFGNNDFLMPLTGTSHRRTTPLIKLWHPTAISLSSISCLKGLQMTIWNEIVGGQLLERVFDVRKEVHSNIRNQIQRRLSPYVDKMMQGPSEEVSNDKMMKGPSDEVSNEVVHKITEELRQNIMEGPHLKEALDKAVDGMLKEPESSLKAGPFKELAVLMRKARRTKEASDELIVDLARLDRNLEGQSKKDSHCHRVIERCVALIVPECGNVRNYIEEIKRKLEAERKMKELINYAITKIENSEKEGTDERDKIIKSITFRDSKSGKTVEHVDRRDKKASRKDGGMKK